MTGIERIAETRQLTIRNDLRPGDLGLIVSRHGALYAAEFGWNIEFEALVATIAGEMIQRFDPQRERAWIAELDGRFAGCVFLVRKSDEQAKLRLLLVEPDARGLGIGAQLVAACIDFARAAGYRSITLWTNDVLTGARHIYARAGFVCVSSEPAPAFGQFDLVSETWVLTL